MAIREMALPAQVDEPIGEVGRRALAEAAWLEVGSTLARERVELHGQGSRHMWQVGEWLLAGEDRVLKHIKRAKVREMAANLTGYSRHTLTMAVSVARRVDPATRVDGLSWWHHLAVAKLARAEQTAWLTRAAEEGWPVKRLLAELRRSGLTHERPGLASTGRVIGALVRLKREQIPDSLLAELNEWWRREIQVTFG